MTTVAPPRPELEGRTLDTEVCRCVMGLPVIHDQDLDDFMTHAEPGNPAAGWWLVPPYSTDISAAWEVVEKLRGKGMWMQIYMRHDNPEITYRVQFGEPSSEWTAVAMTAPLAICKAALAALEATT